MYIDKIIKREAKALTVCLIVLIIFIVSIVYLIFIKDSGSNSEDNETINYNILDNN